MTRWGPLGVPNYQENLDNLLKTVEEVVIGSGGKFIWINGLPMSRDLNSAAMSDPNMEFQGPFVFCFKSDGI